MQSPKQPPQEDWTQEEMDAAVPMPLGGITFDDEIKSGVVIVDFYTPACGPCKALAPILDEIQGAKIVKVNATENVELAAKYGVSAVPNLVFFKDGTQVDRMIGLTSKEKIQNKIDSLANQN